jgi:predicted dehydrogenase
VRAMQAGKDVLIELPLATTLEDAHRIVAAQQATGRNAFVDMFSRFSPAAQQLYQAVADQRHGPLRVLEIEGRTALLWEGYDLGLDTLALDMMRADLDLVTSLLGRPGTVQVTGTGGERPIDLPAAGPPYAAVIDHVLACLTGHASNLIEPASALSALELTLDVHQRLTQAAS